MAPLTWIGPAMLVGAIGLGCGGELPEPTFGRLVAPDCAESDAERFFPERSLAPDANSDDFLRQASSSLLAAAGEPSLSCGTGPAEAYRFIWIHAFSLESPVIVTATNVGSRWRSNAMQLTFSAERFAPTTPIQRALSPQQSEELLRAIQKSDFWTTIGPASDPQGATDGASWIIEGRRGTAYHVVRRWGLHEGSLYDAALALVNVAGLPVPPLMADP